MLVEFGWVDSVLSRANQPGVPSVQEGVQQALLGTPAYLARFDKQA